MFIQNLQFNSEGRQKIFKYRFYDSMLFCPYVRNNKTIIFLDDKLHIV